MCSLNKVLNISLILRANQLVSEPPISTILGNVGVNSVQFCNEFNEYTKLLTDYFFILVFIIAYDDKSYEFIIKEPSISFFLRSVSYKKIFILKFLNIEYECVNLIDIYYISLFKYGSIEDFYLKQIYGIVYSMNLNVIK
jgi:hypothetical protein